MYKLIFADDENLVRNKISQMIDWEKAGFTLSGCCANGYELMELLEKEIPDLVILDINMPFITGLEAARQIRHSYPHTRLVFLTGYTDFKFAQQAVELNALKYIVKPVAAQELLNVLEEARAELDEESRRIRKMADLEHFYLRNQAVLLQDLLNINAKNDTVYDRTAAHGLNWNTQTYFQVAVFSPDKTGRSAEWADVQEETILYALCNVISEIAQGRSLGFACIREGVVALIGYSYSGDNFELEMQNCAEYLLSIASGKLKFTVTAGLGNQCQGCTEIANSFCEALKALELRTKEGNNRLYTVQDLQGHACGHMAVWNAVNYIESSYADPNLSADAVCEYLHLSPSYLRALFKQQIGNTIIGYITKARMERARTLLADGKLKNYGIAEMVGYSDPHYFSYCFKRYYGMSPVEMREHLRRSSI